MEPTPQQPQPQQSTQLPTYHQQPPQPQQPAWHSLNYNPPPLRQIRPVQPLTVNGKALTSGWIVGLTLVALTVLCGCFGSGYVMGLASTSASATATTGTNAGVVNQPTQQTQQMQPTVPVTPISAVPKATDTPSNIVLTVSGNGEKTTAAFTVRGTWQVEWTCSGDILIQFYDTQTNDYAVNLDDIQYSCPASGGGDTSIMHGSGTYYLSVMGGDAWGITVTDLPN